MSTSTGFRSKSGGWLNHVSEYSGRHATSHARSQCSARGAACLGQPDGRSLLCRIDGDPDVSDGSLRAFDSHLCLQYCCPQRKMVLAPNTCWVIAMLLDNANGRSSATHTAADLQSHRATLQGSMACAKTGHPLEASHAALMHRLT